MLKLSCEHVQRLLESFEDNQLDGVTSLAVQLHLDECARCRQRLAWNEELMAALHRLADQTPVPQASLRRQVLDVARVAQRRPVFLRLPLTRAAAIALLVVGVGTYWFLHARGAASVAAFVENHRRSLAKPRPVELETNDPQQAEAWLRDRLAFPVKLPPNVPATYRLRGARLCEVGGERVGFLLYERDGRKFSCFIRPSTAKRLRGMEMILQREEHLVLGCCGGHQIAVWESGGLSYVLVSDAPADTVLAFAREAMAAL